MHPHMHPHPPNKFLKDFKTQIVHVIKIKRWNTSQGSGGYNLKYCVGYKIVKKVFLAPVLKVFEDPTPT